MEMAPLTPLTTNAAFANHRSRDELTHEQTAAEFESVFVSLLLKEMRNTLSEGFFGAESSDVLGGMFDQYMGQHIAAGSQFGIKDLVLQQQSQQLSAMLPNSLSNPLPNPASGPASSLPSATPPAKLPDEEA